MGKRTFIGISLLALGVLLGLVINRHAERIWPNGAQARGADSGQRERTVAVEGAKDAGFQALARSVGAGVVSVAASAKGESLGSGVIMSGSGHVVTSSHLVADAESIKVTLDDGRIFNASLIGSDSRTDLAVIKFDAPAGLTALGWADSDLAATGDYVLAFGNPFGLERTVTLGIISARGRAKVGIAAEEDFLQTDAAINPGNSGGPLVDAAGRVVGIVTGAYSQAGAYPGIGFAVPSNLARVVADALVRDGRMMRGWIGATAQDLTPELAQMFEYKAQGPGGVLISDVTPGGPAASAGLRRGDIIIKFGEHAVESRAAFDAMVAQSGAGQKLQVTLYRAGRQWRAELSVAPSPDESEAVSGAQKRDSAPAPDAMWGVAVVPLTEDISRQLGLRAEDRYGVVVSSLSEVSLASRAGLRRGDVIQSIGGRRIASPGEFGRAVGALKSSEPVLLFINRGVGGMFYLTVSAS